MDVELFIETGAREVVLFINIKVHQQESVGLNTVCNTKFNNLMEMTLNEQRTMSLGKQCHVPVCLSLPEENHTFLQSFI